MKNYDDTHIKKITDYVQEAYVWAEEDNIIDAAVNMNMKEIIDEVRLSKNTISEKVNILHNLLKDEIKKFLLTYNKIELMIGLLELKTFLRTKMSGEYNGDYEIINRHEEILYLIQIVLSSCENEFKNKSLIDGTKNLAMSFRFSYYYNVLSNNIEWFLSQGHKVDTTTVDISDFFKEGVFYTDSYNKYMDNALLISQIENPDDMNIETLSIKEKVESKGISKEKIKENIDNIIKKYFNLCNLNEFVYWGLRQKPEKFLIIKDKKEYFDLIKRKLDKSYDVFNSIIKTFSLNSLLNKKSLLNDLRHIELRSIFESENTIIFYPFDFIYNCSCFEKFMLRRHFVEYYSILLDVNKREELNKELSKHEADISTYLAYVIADQLYINGYKLPMEDGSPYAEVKSIVVNDRLNLLKDGNSTQGDIDVLALNDLKKEIYNIEIKYYKPLHNLRDINSEHKIEERKKNIINPQKRACILKNNIKEVINFLGGHVEDSDKYKVRTIFITPRPDYWLFTDGKDIEYYTWVDFINEIKNKSI